MKKLIVKVLLVASAVGSISPILWKALQAQPETAQLSVGLEIGTPDGEESLRDQIESYIKRELRSLGDVVVNGPNPDCRIIISAFYSYTEAGQKTGVVLSATYLTTFKIFERALVEALTDSLFFRCFSVSPKSGYEYVSWVTFNVHRLTEQAGFFFNSDLWQGPPENLSTKCQRLVAYVDTHILETIRQE